MSFFRRVANLAKGTFAVTVREWGEKPEPDAPELEPSVRRSDPPSPEVSPPSAPAVPTPPERNEHGEVKRTL